MGNQPVIPAVPTLPFFVTQVRKPKRADGYELSDQDDWEVVPRGPFGGETCGFHLGEVALKRTENSKSF